uniref:deoxyhypusine monooxygenase n=1 Tax=Saimiri boliviensis boliviensis TaxID=39432 RepID=A0A2K6SPB6_SAIBB
MVTEQEVEAIGRMLVDPRQPLHARFRALFTLRGLGGPGAIAWISQAFGDDSALLKHELAYCLGQMQDARAIPVLVAVLQDTRQEPMVRHEAGEALGAIGDPQVLELLKQYSSDPVIEVAETCQLAVRRLEWLGDPERVVRESCEVALDMYEHETGLAFQYADGLEQLRGAPSE